MYETNYEFVQDIVLWTGLFCCFLVIVGFVRPTILLWWEDTQNRIKILRFYGLSAFILLCLYYISLFIPLPN